VQLSVLGLETSSVFNNQCPMKGSTWDQSNILKSCLKMFAWRGGDLVDYISKKLVNVSLEKIVWRLMLIRVGSC